MPSAMATLRSHARAVMAMILLLSIHGCNATLGQQYVFKHAGRRKGCANEVVATGTGVFMGYLNKTCNAGTAGPLLRDAAGGQTWNTFTLRKVGKSTLDEDLVEIQTYYPKSSSKPRCQGYIVPEKKGACNANLEPLAGKVGINAKNGDVWAVSGVKGVKDTYTVQAYFRKAGCLKYLAASASCSENFLQLDAEDDGSGRQHWQIIPVKIPSLPPPLPPSPPSRKSPPPLPQLVEVPAVNYSIALTGYNSNSFGSPEQTAFCNSILDSRTYPQKWMRCNVVFVTDMPLRSTSYGRKLMQGNTVYVQGYTAFEFVYNNATSQQQAENAADDLFNDMNSPNSLQNIFQSSFNSSTITSDGVGRGQVSVPENMLPSSPPPSSPTPSSPTPSPSVPGLSPEFNTFPGGDGVIYDQPPVTSSPQPVPVPIPIPVPTPVPVPPPPSPPPPFTAPGAPTNPVFTVNTGAMGTVNAAWTAPVDTGGTGATLTYDILCTPNTGPAVAVSANGIPITSHTLTGLTLGGTYSCSVLARNNGLAGPSAYSPAVTGLFIPTVPSAPSNLVCTPQSATPVIVSSSWTIPVYDGGAAIDTYGIQCTNKNVPVDVVTSTVSAAVACNPTTCFAALTGMTDQNVYTCKVLATNSAGSSPYSNPTADFTACFPRMGTVQLHNGIQKYMYQLVPGDRVLSVDSQGKMSYSPIYVLPHAEPHGIFRYRKFTMAARRTEKSTTNSTMPSTFTVSPDHYLLLAPHGAKAEKRNENDNWFTRRAVKAGDAMVGDQMWVANNAENTMELTSILKIDEILDEGMYAPLTLSGIIVVDGVAASVYNAMLGSEKNMHVFCAWGRLLYRIWPQFFIRMHELLHYPEYKEHEVKALWEFLESTGRQVEVVGVMGPMSPQKPAEAVDLDVTVHSQASWEYQSVAFIVL